MGLATGPETSVCGRAAVFSVVQAYKEKPTTAAGLNAKQNLSPFCSFCFLAGFRTVHPLFNACF